MAPYEKEAFKFCMVCGSDFETLSNIEKYCHNCGYRYFICGKSGSSALIVNSQNEILLIKRGREPMKGTWDVPAGFSDELETFEETLKREMMEELNLKVSNFEYFKSYVGDYEYKGVIKRYISACFIVKVSDKELETIKPGDDAEELKWVKLNGVNYDEIGFPAAKQRIKDYIEYQKNNSKN